VYSWELSDACFCLILPPSVPPPRSSADLTAALRITLLYAAFAGVWILFSDQALLWITADAQQVAQLSMAKGGVFVLVTSLMLYGLVARLVADLNASLASVEQHRAELTVSEERLKATLDALPDLLFEVGLSGRLYQYHSHRHDLLAAPPEAFLGRRFDELLPPEASAACMAAIAEAAEQGISMGQRYSLRLPQGLRWFEISVSAMQSADLQDPRFILIARDVTQRQLAEDQMELASRVFASAREGIMVTDAKGSIIDVNAAFTTITGYSREEAMGQNPRMLSSGRQGPEFYAAMWASLAEHGYWSGEIWNRRKTGEVYAELLTLSAVRQADGAVSHYVALFSDVTAQKNYQTELERMAHFDVLTGLPNRLLLADRMQQALRQATRRQRQVAVLFLDLDGFKAINDRHGHAVGDQLLVALAHRIREALRDGDTLARVGGDEFAAVLLDLEDPNSALAVVERCIEVAAIPFAMNNQWLQVSASVGVTFYPQADVLDAEQLLRQADQAMYQAKVQGKNRYCVFDAQHDNTLRHRHEWLDRIREGLHAGEFCLQYQPKVDMHAGVVVGVEALIRWQHPEKGRLRPADFLPMLENHALAAELDDWVVGEALAQHVRWLDAGLCLPVSVNAGALYLQRPDFVERLQQHLLAHPRFRAQHLQLEILETSALQDMAQASRVIEACKSLGVLFALDDFGTGYSSLTYLRRLDIAAIKVDQSFVRDMLDSPHDLAILRGIVGLAHAFELQVVAEGVETTRHGEVLLELGCHVAQGYGIAHPMEPDAVPSWVAGWTPPPSWRPAA
jgi:diguanylate cyclase (GGDEF)-like protein/PAS domain S-box-containing protein